MAADLDRAYVVNGDDLRIELASSELEVMDKIAALLRTRSDRAKRRILRWALDYLLDGGEPPF